MYVRLDSLRDRATAALVGVIVVLASSTAPVRAQNPDRSAIRAEVTRRHDDTVKRLQEWIAQPAIAAEDRGFPAGAEYMAKLARDAGFQKVSVVTTDGKPGVFATLDAGAPRTVGLYFMYDVKQFDPAECRPSGRRHRSKRSWSTSLASAR
jgi:hypothetical protein